MRQFIVPILAATLFSCGGISEPEGKIVTVIASGDGVGTIEVDGKDCSEGCSKTYEWGTVVTMSEQHVAPNAFGGWAGDCSGFAPTCSVTVTDEDLWVTASFDNAAFSLNVSVTGNGVGTVTADVGDIDCGTNCSDSYSANTSVTLTASPNAESEFDGWTENGSPIPGCLGLTCALTMESARSIQAAFVNCSPCY